MEVSGTCDYKVAKSPGYGNMSIDDLFNRFNTADKWFTWYLEEFFSHIHYLYQPRMTYHLVCSNACWSHYLKSDRSLIRQTSETQSGRHSLNLPKPSKDHSSPI